MSSTSTRAPYGMSFSGPGQTGGNDGPFIDVFKTGTGDIISELSQYKAQGVRGIFKFAGSAANYQNPDLSWNSAGWKSMVSQQLHKGSVAQWRNFVLDGTLLAHNVNDDFLPGSPVFGGNPPSMDDIDEICQYSKSILTFLPCVVRGHNQVLASKSNWTYLDAGWMQWHKRYGAAEAWFVNNINAGRAVGLGSMLGFNLLHGGSGKTAPWNFDPSNPTDTTPTQFGMSPVEIDAITAAIQSAATLFIGMYGWSADPHFDDADYYSRADLQPSLTALANAMVGRAMGPLNWREGSPSGSTDTGSGSTVTVGGNWAIRDDGAGTIARKNGTFTVTCNPPTNYAAGDLHCILSYSRDSGLTAVAPSGWSEANRITSGSSAQGGELVLFYKIGSGNSELATAVSYPGAGGQGGTSQLARWFVISHASTVAVNLVAVAGSGRSWASKTGMGPIPGATSIRSDALFLICGARTDDFGGGSVDENNMSATTGPESWNRVFMTGTANGLDAGFFVDAAATTGIASIDTKSYSQLSGTAAGAGCGFMVAFAPFSVVAGTPPLFRGTADDGFGSISVSVGSNVSLTLASDGSTPFTYSKTSGPSNVTINSSTGRFDFTPTSAGTYVIVLKVSNSFGSDSDQLTVFALVPSPSNNNAPVITHPGNKTVAEHDLLSFVIQATDADGDPLTYALEGGAPAGTYIDSTTGQFIWIPNGKQSGVYPIVANVSDGRAESRSTFTVTVTDSRWAKERGPSSQFGQISSTGNGFTRII